MLASPDEPRTGTPPPSPTSDALVLFPVLGLIVLCALFILFRRAHQMRGAVAYRLKNRTLRGPGKIRLGDEEGGELSDGDDLDESDGERAEGAGDRLPPSNPILPLAPSTRVLPNLHLIPPTPAADPSAIFDLGPNEETDTLELPARIGAEEVVQGVKELEAEEEGRLKVGKGSKKMKKGRK